LRHVGQTAISERPAHVLPDRQRGDRLQSQATPPSALHEPRPVLLGTLSVRIEPTAERMAFESALETGARLIIANMLMLPAYPLTVMLAPECATLPHEEDLEAVRAVAARAAAVGLHTELLRVSTPQPVKALLAIARERQAGLLVFGPDRTRLPRWRLWSAVRAVRRDAPCLVWIAPNG
jgi:hypothetical protein